MLDYINNCDEKLFIKDFENCCGSSRWVDLMLEKRPFSSIEDVFFNANKIWTLMDKKDILEAFSHHPKIGDIDSLKKKFANTAHLALNEQSGVNNADDDTLNRLSLGNKAYEDKFGYIFIVCATGKSAKEMLSILEERLKNSSDEELIIASGEQAKITTIRIGKLMKL